MTREQPLNRPPLTPVAAANDPLELLAGDDRNDSEPALALGSLQKGTDVIELAIVPARPIGLLQLKDRDPALGRERLDLATEPIPDRAQQRRRQDLEAEMAEKTGPPNLTADLQDRQPHYAHSSADWRFLRPEA